mmetsp:Transcript_41593/g.75403  ORF Transcript_41593/g.75403 Transcript_41593/m.75403 type:complete len:117 (-) Transcript_41593:266-616(-)
MGAGASAALGEQNEMCRESSVGCSSRNTNASQSSQMSRTASGSQQLKKSQYPRRIRHLHREHQKGKEHSLVLNGSLAPGSTNGDWQHPANSTPADAFFHERRESGSAAGSTPEPSP